jgi:DNA-binding transcriptional MerR regulator
VTQKQMDKTTYKGKDYLTTAQVEDYYKVNERQLRYWQQKDLIKSIAILGFANTKFYEIEELLKVIKQK